MSTFGLTIADLRGYLDTVPEQTAQRITVTGAPTSGGYVLAYEGNAAGSLGPQATAGAVHAALLPVIAPAVGDPDPIRVFGPVGGPYEVTFRKQRHVAPSLITLASSTLAGGTNPTVEIAPSFDLILGDILERATAVVAGQLLPVVFAPYEGVGARLVRTEAARSRYLKPPPHQAGSVTGITQMPTPDASPSDGVLVTGWVQMGDGYLVREEPWPSQVWLWITATWGYGPADPAAQQLVLELATNMWRQRDRGLFSESQGVDGAGQVTYIGGLTRQQQAIVQNIRRRYKDIVQ